MKIEQLGLVKENDKGKVFQAAGFEVVYRSRDSISGDNSENVEELIYLVSGKAELTISNQTQIVEAPAEIVIPAKTYHKILAVTELIFLLFKK